MYKEEILKASKKIFNEFSDTCLQISDNKFFFQPAEKWSIAQNVDHITRSVKTTRLAYSLPKIVIRTLFGKANRPSRTYERGVEDETFSCGTGVTAAAIICYHNENGFNDVQVKTLGGTLTVEFDRLNDTHYNNVWLSGPAEKVFEGDIEL